MTQSIFFLNCYQHPGNFKPQQFPSGLWQKLLPGILFEKCIDILASEMASPRNRHCANCIGALSFRVQMSSRQQVKRRRTVQRVGRCLHTGEFCVRCTWQWRRTGPGSFRRYATTALARTATLHKQLVVRVRAKRIFKRIAKIHWLPWPYYWHCCHTRQALCNGLVSVRPVDRQQQQYAAGLLLNSDAGSRCLSPESTISLCWPILSESD